MPYALSPLPVMNIASSFLFHAACKFAVGSSLCGSRRLGEHTLIHKKRWISVFPETPHMKI